MDAWRRCRAEAHSEGAPRVSGVWQRRVRPGSDRPPQSSCHPSQPLHPPPCPSYYAFAAGAPPAEAAFIAQWYKSTVALDVSLGKPAPPPDTPAAPWRLRPLPRDIATLEFNLIVGWMLTIDPALRPTAQLLLRCERRSTVLCYAGCAAMPPSLYHLRSCPLLSRLEPKTNLPPKAQPMSNFAALQVRVAVGWGGVGWGGGSRRGSLSESKKC
jgi:hypothetical protein